jgi:hypothetical protein
MTKLNTRYYLIKGFGVKGRHRVEMLDISTRILSMYSILRETYYVAPLEKKLELKRIREFLMNESVGGAYSATAFSIFDTKEKKAIDQSITYFPKTGEFSMVYSMDELNSPDRFVNDWISIFPISNAICSLMDYRLSFHAKWFKPPNSNLFQGLGLSNDRDGYVEGVSAEMWLGDSFWQYAKCTKDDVLKQNWLHCEERPTHLYVRAWPEPFSSAEGEQGEIQRRLLDLLFGINGKTPPPLPPTAQNTIVRKLLVDGDKLRDLGMEEVRPDGSRVTVFPPAPPPAR